MRNTNHFRNGDDLDAVRAALAGRVSDCWARLDDVVGELLEVHGVEMAAIIERLDTVHPDRRGAPEADPPLG